MDKLYRTSRFDIAELGLSNDGDGKEVGIFSGHATAFNEYCDAYNEIIDPGAFNQTLNHNRGQVPIYWMHGAGMFAAPSIPVGIGLSAHENEHGLWTEGRLDIENNEEARSVWGFMKLAHEVGRPVGESIGFSPVKSIDVEGVTHRKEVRLHEWSLTPPDWQAYSGATVDQMRSNREAFKSFLVECLRDLEMLPPEAQALEAVDTTQDANDEAEARLLHSLTEAAAIAINKLRS